MKKYEQVLVEFYNTVAEKTVASTDQIPVHVLDFLLTIPYVQLVRPLILRDLQKNSALTERYLAIRYSVGRQVVRTIRGMYQA